MPGKLQVLAEFDDFSGGHWGAAGAAGAGKNQYGGINMLPTRTGGLASASQSRWIETDAPEGKVWGQFWAWGTDGLLYFIQQGTGADDDVFTVKRFNPDPDSAQTVEDIDDLGGAVVALPDWVAFGPDIYVTIYGDETYVIDPVAPSLTKLTGSDGDAAAGRCMCVYRDRMVIGGINDDRFGDHPNRLIYSGSSPDDVPFDVTRWPSLQFIDLGPDDGTFIVGLYPMRDGLVAAMSDQSMWLITGSLGVNETVRRMTGYQKGSGSISIMEHHHAAVDPSQSRLWLYDHTRRAPARYNGATVVGVEGWGVPMANRTGSGLVQGVTVMIGGPDEFVMDRVALPRLEGDPEGDGAHRLLVRRGGQFAVVDFAVLQARQG